MISIDESGSDSLELVQSYRKSKDMDWVVSFNASGTILDDFGVSGIPTFFVVKPDGKIAWSQVGYAVEYREIFLGELKAVFPADTVDPVIETMIIGTDTEFSIMYPEISVYANVTDDREATEAVLIVDNGDSTKEYELTLKNKEGYQLISQNVSLDRLHLYGYSSVDVKISVNDFYENSDTETTSLVLATYTDTAAPIINYYFYNVTQIDDSKFNIETFIEVTEDLLIVEASVHLYKGTDLKKTAMFSEYNATHMKATIFSIYYVDGDPTEYSLKIEIIDVAGNIALVEVDIEEQVAESSFVTVGLILSTILVVGLAFKKRKR